MVAINYHTFTIIMKLRDYKKQIIYHLELGEPANLIESEDSPKLISIINKAITSGVAGAGYCFPILVPHQFISEISGYLALFLYDVAYKLKDLA